MQRAFGEKEARQSLTEQRSSGPFKANQTNFVARQKEKWKSQVSIEVSCHFYLCLEMEHRK